MRIVLSIFLLLFALPAAAQRLAEVTLDDGRFYQIAVPEAVANPPLIIALHGGGGSPRQYARDAGLTAKALAAGYAVAYPAGSARFGNLRTWNVGYCCAYAAAARIDDIGFLDRVIADAASRYGINPRRVYLTGMSNGAMMAQTYAAKRPDAVRAVASVAGTMDVAHIRPQGPVPLLHIHGSADSHVPFAGGFGPDSKVETIFAAVDDVLAAFRRAQAGRLLAATDTIDPAPDGMSVSRTQWRDRNGVAQVVLLKVIGGGHHWPGGKRSDRRGATQDIDAATEALRFFAQHP
ncbi:alpha/beta hydrolase family esterase [Rhodobacter ferrooxidans]|uniref:Polyhydroxybutyrate depolymerase n=1 Tax=Rhodobacter ferrooxidans TaxID=371731 RepID=C8RZ16_9RHOB|nr:PHB depolymerase family esterase [Rhodobacter sp. SW2]EEW25973.1 polyhydroxybutyrate depolymerase [Rhodobacter sp. SW2]